MTAAATAPAPAAEKPAAIPADLANLQAEAVALDAAAAAESQPPQDATAEAAPVIDYAAESVALVDTAAATLAAFYPSTAAVLTPEKRAPIAAALAPVMQKYGWNMGDIFAKWWPEIGLGFAVLPVAVPLLDAIKADRTAAAAAVAPPPEKTDATGTETPPASDLYKKV